MYEQSIPISCDFGIAGLHKHLVQDEHTTNCEFIESEILTLDFGRINLFDEVGRTQEKRKF